MMNEKKQLNNLFKSNKLLNLYKSKREEKESSCDHINDEDVRCCQCDKQKLPSSSSASS